VDIFEPALNQLEISGSNVERRLGFVFLSKEGIERIRSAGGFSLWEGRFIGEATVIN
jgi:hypothetical protein